MIMTMDRHLAEIWMDKWCADLITNGLPPNTTPHEWWRTKRSPIPNTLSDAQYKVIAKVVAEHIEHSTQPVPITDVFPPYILICYEVAQTYTLWGNSSSDLDIISFYLAEDAKIAAANWLDRAIGRVMYHAYLYGFKHDNTRIIDWSDNICAAWSPCCCAYYNALVYNWIV
jgi:hypothetical protein